MSVTATRRYPCAICGKRDLPERMVFSTYTRNRYCVDDRACKRRAKKARR